jgi:hypothetical protein
MKLRVIDLVINELTIRTASSVAKSVKMMVRTDQENPKAENNQRQNREFGTPRAKKWNGDHIIAQKRIGTETNCRETGEGRLKGANSGICIKAPTLRSNRHHGKNRH